jgi:hypothetical protein
LKSWRQHCDRDGGFKKLGEPLKLIDRFKLLRLHCGTGLNDDDERNGVNDDDGDLRKMELSDDDKGNRRTVPALSMDCCCLFMIDAVGVINVDRNRSAGHVN